MDEATTVATVGTAGTQRCGVVAELWRYPVKSMQGERVRSARMGPNGIAGDRRYGLIGAGGDLLTAKSVPELFLAGARTDDGRVVVSMPDGSEVVADDPDASDRISRWLGRDVVLRESGPGHVSFELTFDPPDDEAEMVAWPALADTFLDVAPVSALTTASLAQMASLAPDSVWDVRRFRPNVLVDTGDLSGFMEDGWVGREVAIGADGAALHVDMASVRCAMPLRAQPAWAADPPLERDTALFAALTKAHNYHLGVYCTVASTGEIVVGDRVGLGAPPRPVVA